MFKIKIAGFVERFAGAVLINAILKMFGNAVARNKGKVSIFKLKPGVTEHACRAHLDNPDPEIFAAHGCSVKVHKNSVEGVFRLNGQNGVIYGISNCGLDACKSVRTE